MKVRVLRSFAGSGYSYGMGEIIDLPPGVDWLEAGLVEKVKAPRKKTTATAEPKGERAAPKKPRRRRGG